MLPAANATANQPSPQANPWRWDDHPVSVPEVPMPAAGYERTVIREDNEGELVLVSWAPQSSSELHGHGASHVTMRVLSGRLREERYLPDNGGYRYQEQWLEEGQVSELPSGAFHRLQAETGVRSIHAYLPALGSRGTEVPPELLPLLERAREMVHAEKVAGDGPPAKKRYTLPTPLYLGLRLVDALRPLFLKLGQLESLVFRRRLATMAIDRPLYICGVPRAGTTVTLELLSEHPSLASHRYADMLMPYLPYTWNLLTKEVLKRIPDEPQERIHQDRLQVTKLSPDGSEEMLWMPYFSHLHSSEVSCVLDASAKQPAFDRFYTNTIKKLLLVRQRSRYLSKTNESATRLLYLHRLFPDARFLLFIRHPVQQIASLMKTDRLFRKLANEDPRVVTMTSATGHYDFGTARKWARIDHTAPAIERYYREGDEVSAWAMHWSAVYSLVQEQLRANPTLAARTLIVRYEDLCHAPAASIDRLLAHCELDPTCFSAVRERYLSKLSEPTYYRPDFTEEELTRIDALTKSARLAYGYTEDAGEMLAKTDVARKRGLKELS